MAARVRLGIIMRLFGGIEAGGTKFVCGLADAAGSLLETTRFPTTAPGETIGRAVAFFRGRGIEALGVASFGPADLQPGSPTWGHITATPKPGWSNTNLVGELADALGVPVAFDTDVNGAALGEHRWGAAQGLDPFIYLTVGTGIGGGGMAGGRLLHGLVHPEMGHIPIPRDPAADPFPGVCPFHGDCLEGLAAGPAIQARWGAPGETLPDEHPAWELEAHYLSLGLASLILALSPQRIIIGGGVGARPAVLGRVRAKTLAWLNGYVQHPAVLAGMDVFIVPPALGGEAGVRGAVALALTTDDFA
jgi:fructokinase